jgi:hypothetical protein
MGQESVLGETYPVYSKIGFSPLTGHELKGMPIYTSPVARWSWITWKSRVVQGADGS